MNTLFHILRGAAMTIAVSAVCLCVPAGGPAAHASTDVWTPLFAKLIEDGGNADRLAELFARAEYDPYPMRRKLHSLFDNLFGEHRVKLVQTGLRRLGYATGDIDGKYGPRTHIALLAFQRDYNIAVDGLPGGQVLRTLQNALPKGKKLDIPEVTRDTVYRNVLMPSRLDEARDFFKDNKHLLSKATERFGVAEEVAVGILTVETRLGSNLGQRKAFVTLASMALAEDFSKVLEFFEDEPLLPHQVAWLKRNAAVRSAWAYKELKALLQYAEDNHIDPLSMVGSVYGAIGISQFMPTSLLAYGADGDGDGDVDIFAMEDAVHSLAHYLHRHGIKTGTCSDTRKALFHYNRSTRYVNTVIAVADHLRKQDGRPPVCPVD